MTRSPSGCAARSPAARSPPARGCRPSATSRGRSRSAGPSVREAIAALKNDGLVETRAGAGTYVAPTRSPSCSTRPAPRRTRASPRCSRRARRSSRASPRSPPAAAQRDEEVEQLLDLMESIDTLDDAAARARWRDADRFFHRRLAAMTGNPLLADIADTIATTMDQPLWRRLHDEAVTDLRRTRLFAAEHRLIYEAIVDGDEEAAALYAGRHVTRVRRDITE